MGWLFTKVPAGTKTIDYLKQQFEHENENMKLEILDASARSGVCYMLCQTTLKDLSEKIENKPFGLDENNSNRFALVVLYKRSTNVHGELEFGYKDMDETMGPVESKCPQRILDKLSPLDPERVNEDGGTKWAHEWRERCRAYNAKPKFKVGDVIRFAEPIKFTDGSTRDVFKVVRYMKKGIRFESVDTWATFKISNAMDREYEILPKA